MDGAKYDQDKPRWDLLPWDEVEDVVRVLTYGARKYEDENWKKVPLAEKRYLAAAMRHIVAMVRGEHTDSESGISHLAHAACCLLFLAWFDKNKNKEHLKHD